MKALLISHGHPDLTIGGAETATYNLFQALKSSPQGIEPVFLARDRSIDHRAEPTFTSYNGRIDEYLWNCPSFDEFRLLSTNPDLLRKQFDEIVDSIQPDLIHVGHYFAIGLELIEYARARSIPVVLTLHEYYLMCANQGQMRRNDGAICESVIFANCANCIPGYSSGKFFLRSQHIARILTYVGALISPSQFLADQFLESGLVDTIVVVENQLIGDDAARSQRRAENNAIRFGFFGQISLKKGVGTLLDAFQRLEDLDVDAGIELHIFGEQTEPNAELELRLETASAKAGNIKIHLHGRYDNAQVISLMSKIDWVILPSLWWENSPLVIQEANAACVPVLASNIGALKEKVRENENGTHFLMGSCHDLARKVLSIAEKKIQCEPTSDLVRRNELSLQQHLEIYQSLVAPTQIKHRISCQ